jgi:hypothetical protein
LNDIGFLPTVIREKAASVVILVPNLLNVIGFLTVGIDDGLGGITFGLTFGSNRFKIL